MCARVCVREGERQERWGMNYVGVGQWKDGLLMTLEHAAGCELQRG